MKSILTLLICNISLYSYTQCVKLYIQEHLSGSPLCNLSAGDYIEICEDENEVNGCPRNFYIYDKGFASGSLTYELSLDRGWNTNYMTLMVNPKTKKIGFILQGQQAIYSYITEKEMENKNRIEEIESQNREKERVEREKIQLKEDINTKIKVESLLNNNNLDEAIIEFAKLNFNDNTLKNKIEIEINKRNKEEDIKTNQSIELLLKNNDLNQALIDFNKLHSIDLIIKSKIQNLINNYYDTLEIAIETSVLNKIINDNKEAFTKVKDGLYKVTMGKDGAVNVQNKDSINKFLICTNKFYFIKNGFEYPSNYYSDISISTKREQIYVGDSIEYIVSEKYKKRDIYLSKKGDYYLSGFSAPLNAKIITKPSFYSEDILGVNINFNQLYKYSKFVNGINILNGQDYFLEKNIVAKKGTGRKIFRIITSPIWGPFYLYYLYSQI